MDVATDRSLPPVIAIRGVQADDLPVASDDEGEPAFGHDIGADVTR